MHIPRNGYSCIVLYLVERDYVNKSQKLPYLLGEADKIVS